MTLSLTPEESEFEDEIDDAEQMKLKILKTRVCFN